MILERPGGPEVPAQGLQMDRRRRRQMEGDLTRREGKMLPCWLPDGGRDHTPRDADAALEAGKARSCALQLPIQQSGETDVGLWASGTVREEIPVVFHSCCYTAARRHGYTMLNNFFVK